MDINYISILVSSLLGAVSLFLGILSLFFAYFFSSKRYKNRFLKEMIKCGKLEIKNRPGLSIKDFHSENSWLHFAEIKEINSFTIPKIIISDNLYKISNWKLFFKIHFIFDKEYHIEWIKKDIAPLCKIKDKIIFGPTESKDFIWPFSKIDPLDNIEISKQAFNLKRALFIEKKQAIKVSKKINKKRALKDKK